MLLFPNTYIISEIRARYHTFYARQRSMKVSLYRLPRSGWSFGRAGLGAKAAQRENNAVGIGLFPFIRLF